MSATPLPPSADFTGSEVSEGGFKTAISNLRSYLAHLLGTDGEPATAQAALGIEPGIPAGGIIMWSGSIENIPAGWALCDGYNGTPDLRNRFVIAAGGVYSVGATGNGSIPQHNHSVSLNTNSTGEHTHDIRQRAPGDGIVSIYLPTTTRCSTQWRIISDLPAVPNGNHSHSVSGNTGITGSGSVVVAIYYALAYIMKLPE